MIQPNELLSNHEDRVKEQELYCQLLQFLLLLAVTLCDFEKSSKWVDF